VLLYYVTDGKAFAGNNAQTRAALLCRIGQAARAGVDYIQLREKELDAPDLERLAREALRIIRENSSQTSFLVNTHADIALAVGADGVHLPAGSLPASEMRARWLRQADREPLIGVSAHSVADARQAEIEGASFAVLAPIFEKAGSGAEAMGLGALHQACATSRLPVLALGGVSLANAGACLDAGAAGVAGIRLFQQGDVGETVAKLRQLASGTTRRG
jgi:thiamine-phosphate pyrophosphorylase